MFSGWDARGSGRTEAAGVRESDAVISWFLTCGPITFRAEVPFGSGK